MSQPLLHRAASITATLALVAAGIAATTSAANAIPPAPGTDPCPTAYDVTTLTPGQTVTGLTTVHGTTPEEFHGTYVGTIDNGIADGLDLPVFDMTGSRITHPDGSVDAGIWAGMSGSPVYDDATGDLIGAVSYGFSSVASPRAGVTPATYMYDLANPKYTSLAAARKSVRATRSEAARIAKASNDPEPLGTGHLLTPTKQVTGQATAKAANATAKKSRLLQRKAPFKAGGFRTGGGSGGTNADYPIQVGGNIATTFSTGAITTAAVGTVTAVCGNQVYAYGHPDEFSGKSNETFNGASAVDVQEDGGFGSSYKIANVGAVKGVITQDRNVGILGTLGQTPVNAVVHNVSTGLGDTKESTTDVAVQFALPYVVGTQVAVDAQNVLNQYSGGEALISWTIHYTRSGEVGPQTFTRSQRYSTSEGFPDEVSYDAAGDVETLLTNGFEKVNISQVEITTDLKPDYRAFKPVSAKYSLTGVPNKNVPSSGIKVKPGQSIHLNLNLGPADFDTNVDPTTLENITVKTSKSSKGNASLRFIGQGQSYFDDEEFFDDGETFVDEGDGEEGFEPESLDDVLDFLLSIPRQDDVLQRFRYHGSHGTTESVKMVRLDPLDAGIVEGSLSLRIVFKK